MSFLVTGAASAHCYTLSLHDALPISLLILKKPTRHAFARDRAFSGDMTPCRFRRGSLVSCTPTPLPEMTQRQISRSEEHTSELQSRFDLVCRLLLENKKQNARLRPSP